MLVVFLMLPTEATAPNLVPQIVTVALAPVASAPPKATVSQPDGKAVAVPQPMPVARPKALRRLQALRTDPTSPLAAERSRPAVASAPAVAGGSAAPPAANASAPSGVAADPAPVSSNPAPEYPETARRKGIEGTVILQVSVAADGQPIAVIVTTGSGHEMLDAEALRTVRRWRFRPALAHGNPIAGLIVVPIVFELHS